MAEQKISKTLVTLEMYLRLKMQCIERRINITISEIDKNSMAYNHFSLSFSLSHFIHMATCYI